MDRLSNTATRIADELVRPILQAPGNVIISEKYLLIFAVITVFFSFLVLNHF